MTPRHLATLVCGNAGAGKSTLALGLAAERGATLIDIDTCTERLVRMVLSANAIDPSDRDSPAYKALLREPVYETMFDIARDNLAHVPCILVGPFTRERRDPEFPSMLARRLDTEVEFVYVHCEPRERKKRLEARDNPRDRQKLDDWERYALVGEDQGPPPFPHRYVDTSQRPRP